MLRCTFAIIITTEAVRHMFLQKGVQATLMKSHFGMGVLQ